MQPISVTFDSNAWENIVDDTKRIAQPVYETLYQNIINKKIIPFFFEGIITTESIPRKDRQEYMKNFKATIIFQVEDEEPHITHGSKAPELTPYLNENIPKALKMGFKFLKNPRIGGIGLDSNSKFLADDVKYSLKERLNRTMECTRYIESLGAGKASLENKLDGNSDKGIIHQTVNDTSVNTKQYAKGIAEWVDGDALGAHYGYGVDYFCTNDNASGAGSSSVFSPLNLANLKSKYQLNVISPNELVNILKQNV
jgi:hypothetical protein